MARWLVVLSLAASLGCDGPMDDPGLDANIADDARVRDAGVDAFVPEVDAGPTPIDAGADAAVAIDAGEASDAGVTPDAGMDAAVGDAGMDAGLGDAGTVIGDGGTDAALADAGTDAGPLLPETTPAPASEVLRVGTGGLLLRGTVLTPTGALDGEVLVVGDTITCVAASCAGQPMADTVTLIDTHAVISPGLIDGHNHLTYNFLDEWVPDPPELFMNRYEWRGDADYSVHTFPESFGGTSGSFICPATKWGELRSIIHGTTTVQGQSPEQACVDRLARNADHFHGLGTDHMRTTISGACESALSDTARPGIVASFGSGTTRFAIHMAEGVSGGGVATSVTSELDCYAGRTRYSISLLEDGVGMPYETALFIHAIPFDSADVMEAIDTGSRFVWSPSSNILLYGDTAPIEEMIALDAVVGIGPDWTVSGSDELLSEMRFAFTYGRAQAIASLSPQRIWQMATYDGADAVGLGAAIGRIAVGYRADLVVFGRVGADPYRAVLDSRAEDVRLVTIDGLGYYGDVALEASTAVNGLCEDIDACGVAKYLCAAGTPGQSSRADETVEDIRTQLVDHIAAVDADPSDTIDRSGQAPLPLIDCSL